MAREQFSPADFFQEVRSLEAQLDKIISSEKDTDHKQRGGAEVYEKLERLKDKLINGSQGMTFKEKIFYGDRLIDIVRRLLIHVFNTSEEQIQKGMEKYLNELHKPPLVEDDVALDEIAALLDRAIRKPYGFTNPELPSSIQVIVESTGRKLVINDIKV